MITQLARELEQLRLAGKHRQWYPAVASGDGTISARGRTLVDFTSWDVLGLSRHPRLKRVLQEEVQ